MIILNIPIEIILNILQRLHVRELIHIISVCSELYLYSRMVKISSSCCGCLKANMYTRKKYILTKRFIETFNIIELNLTDVYYLNDNLLSKCINLRVLRLGMPMDISDKSLKLLTNLRSIFIHSDYHKPYNITGDFLDHMNNLEELRISGYLPMFNHKKLNKIPKQCIQVIYLDRFDSPKFNNCSTERHGIYFF